MLPLSVEDSHRLIVGQSGAALLHQRRLLRRLAYAGPAPARRPAVWSVKWAKVRESDDGWQDNNIASRAHCRYKVAASNSALLDSSLRLQYF